jgi:hypothetical protein
MVVLSWAGLVVWSAALAVTGTLAVAGTVGLDAPATCLAGVLIGVAMLRWARRHLPGPARPVEAWPVQHDRPSSRD